MDGRQALLAIILGTSLGLTVTALTTAVLHKVAPPTAEPVADVSGAFGQAEVKTILIEDGTRCAVLVGYNKGAISCDWTGPKPTNSEIHHEN